MLVVAVYCVTFFTHVIGVWGNGDFLLDENFLFNKKNFYARKPTFIYGGSGCGTDNNRCQCTIDTDSDNGVLQMHGQGTDKTATGLTFTCSYEIHEPTHGQKLCDCKYYVDIPYSGSNEDMFNCTCLKITDYSPISHTGHSFQQKREVRLKPVPIKITYCPTGFQVLNLTHCFGGEHSRYNANNTYGKCPTVDGLHYVHKGNKCGCRKNSFERDIQAQKCPDNAPFIVYTAKDPLTCTDHTNTFKGYCQDNYTYFENPVADQNSGKCIYDCEKTPDYHNYGKMCRACNQEYVKAKCDDEKYPFVYEGKCFQMCPGDEFNFQDRCVKRNEIVPQMVANNACMVSTYEYKESSDQRCEDDCDCNGNRFCEDKMCHSQTP